MKPLFFSLLIFLMLSCSNSDSVEIEQLEETNVDFTFEDGFETSSIEITRLFPNDNSRWTTVQLINPIDDENSLELSSVVSSEGNQSLAIQAKQSNEILSKAAIEKGGFNAFAEDKVTIEADFYIDSDANLENLFLIDLECCSCWDPSVDADPSVDGDNKCPGVRLRLSGVNAYLSIERGKIAGTTLTQTTTQFPRKEWATLRWELNLSSDNNGTNKLFLNGNQILSESAMNLPNAEIFREVFAENEIDFELQEPVSYERVQIGATANPDSEDLLLYVDNIVLRIEKN